MPFSNKIRISQNLKEEIIRYILAFFFAWLTSALISDFPFFSNLVKNSFIDDFLQTQLVVWSETQLNWLGFETFSVGKSLKIIGTSGVRLDYGCLGIRQIAFFAVFILLQFGKVKNKLWYIPGGIILLHVINSIRITLIAYGQYLSESNTQLIHDVATPILFYPAILLFWIYWISKFGKPSPNSLLILPLLKKTISFFRLRKK